MSEDSKKLLSPKAGYSQHTSPVQLYPARILNVPIQMECDNRSDYTTKTTRKALMRISKFASLDEPDAVKLFIAKLKAKDGYKKALCLAYNKYCKYYKIEWTMPLYIQEEQNIALPTKEKLLMLIANASPKLSIKLSISMETGLRPVELCRLKVKDIDHKTVNPITAKRGNARTLPLSTQLANNNFSKNESNTE